MDRHLLENCKREQKVFPGKEQRDEKNKKKISDWLGPHNRPDFGWEGPELPWHLGIGWLDIQCQADYLQRHKSQHGFVLLT